jgi:antitoxin YefM
MYEIMNVINFSEFRNHLKANLDSVSEDNEVVIVNRQKDNNVVLISLKEYNSLQETLHLLSSAKNRERLFGAIERDKVSTFETHDLIQ